MSRRPTLTVRVECDHAGKVLEWWGDTFPALWVKNPDGSVEADLPLSGLEATKRWLGEMGEGEPQTILRAIARAEGKPEGVYLPSTPAGAGGDEKATTLDESPSPAKKPDGSPDLRLY